MRADATTRAPVRWYRDGTLRSDEDLDLLVEEPLEIRLDGEPYTVTMRTPGDDADLVTGILFTEGVVSRADQIVEIARCEDAGEHPENVINVRLRPGSAAAASDKRRTRTFESRSSCGLCGTQMLSQLEQEIPPLSGGAVVSQAALWQMEAQLRGAQPLFRATRGSHAAALFTPHAEPRVVREDVGRHNALDKLIGHCLRAAIDPSPDVLVLSSRASFELIQKAARARIAVVATVSTTSSLARDLAHTLGCTLICALRPGEMMIHTHEFRCALS